ncbi:MAG: gamma carbonic anhydrase family protein [Lachnospiraceae bacterium]|nr:gamma carbonic anhydrase family protein [Lachnospiraceae bacterium]
MMLQYEDKYPQIEKAAFVAENATLIGDVVLEEDATVWFGAVLRGDSSSIKIGKDSNIQDNCTLHCDEGSPLNVGKNVTVGHNVILHGCTIEDNCLIGMGAVIMNDAVIGENSIVGAGALVTEGKVFPANSLILGSPAKAKGEVDEKGVEMIRDAAAHYVHHGKEYQKMISE